MPNALISVPKTAYVNIVLIHIQTYIQWLNSRVEVEPKVIQGQIRAL